MIKENFYNITTAVIEPLSTDVRKLGSSQYLTLGTNNDFLTDVWHLFKNVPTLRTLVEGSALLSSSLFSSPFLFDFNKFFQYLYLFGSCPILVRQSRDKKSLHFTPLNPRFVRTNEDQSMFCYSELEGFRQKIEYPAYSPSVDGSSILMVNLNDIADPYSLPIWSSALREVQILSRVSEYHNSQLQNGFAGSALINFNNGMPDAESKAEIERMVQEKFGGSNNAGRILLSFNESAESAATITPFTTEDTSLRYMDLVKACNLALNTSFRCSPALFGGEDPSATALNATEYAWKLGLFIQFTIDPISRIVYKNLAPFGVTMKDPMSILDSLNNHAETSD